MRQHVVSVSPKPWNWGKGMERMPRCHVYMIIGGKESVGVFPCARIDVLYSLYGFGHEDVIDIKASL